MGLLFFRGSLRTRISLEVAMHQLGGHTIKLTAASSDFWELEEREGSVMDGRAPEHIKDAAAVLSRYVDALAVRPLPERSLLGRSIGATKHPRPGRATPRCPSSTWRARCGTRCRRSRTA